MKKFVSLLCVSLSLSSIAIEAKEYELGAIAQTYYSDSFLDRSPFGDNHKAVKGFVAGNIYASLQSKFETTKPKLSGTVLTSFNIGIAFHSYLNRQFNEFIIDSNLKKFIDSKKKGTLEISTLADAIYVKEINEQIFLEALDALLLEKFVADIGRKLSVSEREKLQKIKECIELKEEASVVSKNLFNEEDVTEEFRGYLNQFETKMKDAFARRKK